MKTERWLKGRRLEESKAEIYLTNWGPYWGMLPAKVWQSPQRLPEWQHRWLTVRLYILYVVGKNSGIGMYWCILSQLKFPSPFQQVRWVFMVVLITNARGRHPVIPLQSVLVIYEPISSDLTGAFPGGSGDCLIFFPASLTFQLFELYERELTFSCYFLWKGSIA